MPLMAGGELSLQIIENAKKVTKAITPEELRAKLDAEETVYMLDIREPYMRPEGSIDGTENIEIARGLLEFDLTDKIENKDAFIVVYCRSGKGAVLSAKTIQEDMHYTNVHYLKGGIDAWLEAGYSIFSHFGEIQLVK